MIGNGRSEVPFICAFDIATEYFLALISGDIDILTSMEVVAYNFMDHELPYTLLYVSPVRLAHTPKLLP